MKYQYILFIAVSFFFSCKNDSNNFNIEGTIKNFGDGEIYFIKSSDEKIIDTVKVSHDQFIYKGTVSEPAVYMVNFGASQQPGFLILEKGKTTLSYEMDAPNSLVVKGGKEQEVYNSFTESCKTIFFKMDSIGKLAEENQQNEQMMYALQQQFLQLNAALQSEQHSFIKNHPSSAATAFIAANYLNENQGKTVANIEEIYNSLDKNIQKSYYGVKIAGMAKMIKSTATGSIAPDFTLPDTNNNDVSLSTYKGKITLLDFWASWCGPCREENPNVLAAYKKYHDKGFEILAVSLDNQKMNWEKAIEKDGLTWTHVSDLQGWSSKVAMLYGIQSIPANFLLDKEGRILARDLRGADLENKLSELFK